MKCFRCGAWPCECDDGCCIIHGDCREVLREIDIQADVLVTDPPYDIVNKFGTNHQNGRAMQFAWDGPDVREVIAGGIEASIARLNKIASAFIFTGFDTVEIARELLRNGGFVVKPAAWVKPFPPPPGKGNWWPGAYELAMYAYRNSPPFFDTDTKRSNVFSYDACRHGHPDRVNHPTPKPLNLMRRIVSSLGGELILDPFIGGGSTLAAAKQLGRKAIGIEIEEKYCEVAAQRLQQKTFFALHEKETLQ